ncbi:class I SAM-dependent methyltransferase [Geodermatophilus sp. SYSU D01176]
MDTTPTVHPGNAAQLRAWDGDEGRRWATHADVLERSTAGYDAALWDAAALTPTDRVLDVGCGTGSTTRAAARQAGAGTVLGVDLSGPMLEVARRRAAAEGLTNVSFLQADAQVHPFPEASVDVVVSRAGAMFFADPVAAFTNLARALRPGGRLALLVWQGADRNEWFRALTTALAAGREPPAPPPGAPGPFAFADPARVREVLTAAGLAEVAVAGHEQPEWFGPDAAAAEDLVLELLGWLLDDLDEAGRAAALAALRDTLTAHEQPDGVRFASAAWLVTARRPA